MDLIRGFFSLFSDLHGTLTAVATHSAAMSYLFIAGIIFVETGFVFMPFLPGDSLLFATGALSATGTFEITLLLPILWAAAVLGDTVNYSIGRTLGKHIVRKGMIKKEHYDKAQAFSHRHGNYAVVLARFFPILRTIVPFVAGMSNMPYASFFFYNVIGGITWVTLFVICGFFFGNIPFVQAHFEIIVLSIILISFAPLMYQAVQATRQSRKSSSK
ncbi:MAG: VTT domain-containing protein [Patescibacteria group bacterium]